MSYPETHPPAPFTMDGTQPLVDPSPWELRLEEGDRVRFEATFLVHELTKYQITSLCLACLIPVVGQVVIFPVLLILMCCCCGRKMLTRKNASQKCVITERSLYYYKSAPACCCFAGSCWGHEQRYIPLDKIQDINITQNWLEGKFGLYTVKIETAGQSGSPDGRPEGRIAGMRDPIGFRQNLLEARGRAPAPVAPTGARELSRVDHLVAQAQGAPALARLDQIEAVLKEQVVALQRIEANTRR